MCRYCCIQQHCSFSTASASFQKTASNLDVILSTVGDRGRSLHKAIDSLNDCMFEGYMDVLGFEGSEASLLYARSLEDTLHAARDLGTRLKRYEQIAAGLRDEYGQIFRAAERERERDNLHRNDPEYQALSLHYSKIREQVKKIVLRLEDGGHEMERFLRKAEPLLPSIEMDSREIKEFIDADISRIRTVLLRPTAP